VAIDTMRRTGIINFIPMTENQWVNVIDDQPLADRALEGDQELDRVSVLLSKLSDTCRRAIILRRIDGLSQRETAERLGVNESDVRDHLVRGLQKVLKAVAEQDADAGGDKRKSDEQEVELIGKHRFH
jgi:RNA polymerase sigma factor (sigma-70 family)